MKRIDLTKCRDGMSISTIDIELEDTNGNKYESAVITQDGYIDLVARYDNEHDAINGHSLLVIQHGGIKSFFN